MVRPEGRQGWGMDTHPTHAGSDEQATSNASADARRIVVGLDGSDASVAALEHGLDLAKALGTSVEGVVAWFHPLVLGLYAVMEQADVEKEAREAATNAANRVFGTDWPEQFALVVREGHPAHVLVEESVNATMLVVGSRGHGGFAGLLLGSVSSACAAHAKCPVLVVHDAEVPGQPASPAG